MKTFVKALRITIAVFCFILALVFLLAFIGLSDIKILSAVLCILFAFLGVFFIKKSRLKAKPTETPNKEEYKPEKRIKKTSPLLISIFSVLIVVGMLGWLISFISDNSTNNSTGKIGEYIVTIKDYKILSPNGDDKQYLLITYEYTNNSKEAASFSGLFNDVLFQNGIEIQTPIVFFDSEDQYNSDNCSKKIAPGKSLNIDRLYELSDAETDVDVEIQRWLSDKKLEYTISLQKAE